MKREREIVYVEPNKAESAREEVEEKIRGKRKPAWGRLEEGVVNTRAGEAAREKAQSLPLDGRLDSSVCAMGWRGGFGLSDRLKTVER